LCLNYCYKSFVPLELELELLVHGDTSVHGTAINAANKQTRGAVVEEGVSKNGMGRDINAEHALGTEVEVDVKTLGVARGDLWWVLGVFASWANLD
jgi:hypothetical protein